MPANTVTPSACRTSAPAPKATTRGTTPMTKAIEVMRIGRSRRCAASSTAAFASRPCSSCRCLANSTMRMAFLHASPTSTSSPICMKMLLSPWSSLTAVSAGSRHIGAEGARHVDNRAQGYHLAGRVAGLERHDVIELTAERGIRLRDDLVGAAETVEVVDVERAEVHLQRLEHVREPHVLALGLDAIDVDVELRHVDLVGAERASERRVLIGRADRLRERCKQGLQAGIGPILHLQLEAAQGAEPDDRRGRHDHDEGILDGGHLLVERRRNGWSRHRPRRAL